MPRDELKIKLIKNLNYLLSNSSEIADIASLVGDYFDGKEMKQSFKIESLFNFTTGFVTSHETSLPALYEMGNELSEDIKNDNLLSAHPPTLLFDLLTDKQLWNTVTNGLKNLDGHLLASYLAQNDLVAKQFGLSKNDNRDELETFFKQLLDNFEQILEKGNFSDEQLVKIVTPFLINKPLKGVRSLFSHLGKGDSAQAFGDLLATLSDTNHIKFIKPIFINAVADNPEVIKALGVDRDKSPEQAQVIKDNLSTLFDDLYQNTMQLTADVTQKNVFSVASEFLQQHNAKGIGILMQIFSSPKTKNDLIELLANFNKTQANEFVQKLIQPQIPTTFEKTPLPRNINQYLEAFKNEKGLKNLADILASPALKQTLVTLINQQVTTNPPIKVALNNAGLAFSENFIHDIIPPVLDVAQSATNNIGIEFLERLQTVFTAVQAPKKSQKKINKAAADLIGLLKQDPIPTDVMKLMTTLANHPESQLILNKLFTTNDDLKPLIGNEKNLLGLLKDPKLLPAILDITQAALNKERLKVIRLAPKIIGNKALQKMFLKAIGNVLFGQDINTTKDANEHTSPHPVTQTSLQSLVPQPEDKKPMTTMHRARIIEHKKNQSHTKSLLTPLRALKNKATKKLSSTKSDSAEATPSSSKPPKAK